MEKGDESTNESKPENSTDGSQETLKDKPKTEVDQEIADEYGWTQQQAKEARLYL